MALSSKFARLDEDVLLEFIYHDQSNVDSVKIENDLMSDKTRLESAMIEAINNTVKKVQKKMAMKLQKMGDLDLPGLS